MDSLVLTAADVATPLGRHAAGGGNSRNNGRFNFASNERSAGPATKNAAQLQTIKAVSVESIELEDISKKSSLQVTRRDDKSARKTKLKANLNPMAKA